MATRRIAGSRAVCALPTLLTLLLGLPLASAGAVTLRLDGVLGRSGDPDVPLAATPEGVTWTPPKEPDRNAFTSYVHRAVACVGTLAETGERLVGTGYPESRVHLFGADGREIVDSVWPRPGWYDRLVNVGGRTWGLKLGATELTRTLRGGRPFRVGGAEAEWTCGIVVQPDGYWLRGHQGWLRYGVHAPTRCVRRHGDLKGVTALALMDGVVYVFSGSRLDRIWLDARPDEPMIGSGFDGGRLAGRWRGEVDAVEVADGRRLRYAFAGEEGSWILDPSVTEWVFRDKREYRVPEKVARKRTQDRLGGFAVEATAGGIVLRDPSGAVACRVPEVATALAAEGDWLVAYVPSKAAILRYRLRTERDEAQEDVRGTAFGGTAANRQRQTPQRQTML